jgi:hypothetical protein
VKNQMCVHCGGKVVDLDELDQVEIPEPTSTYMPVPHRELAENVRDTAAELLRLPLMGETYALARNGNHMFGLQTFGAPNLGKCPDCDGSGVRNDGSPCATCKGTGWTSKQEYHLSVAFRNSYDKTMSIGLAMGFTVFICDNLALNGEIKILRKHTKGVWNDLDQVLVHTLFRKRPEMEAKFHADVAFLKNTEMSVHDGYRLLGFLVGHKVLTYTQSHLAFANWNQHPFNSRNANGWEFYNDCTAALKSTQPSRVLEAHRQLHDLVKAELQ